MKIRNGFVSNSSSSSFVCDVCHTNVSGMDIGLDDAEMFECVDGHTVCDDHLVGSPINYYDLEGLNAKREFCLARIDSTWLTKNINEVESEEELNIMYDDEIKSEERYNMPIDRCPCCTLESVTDKQILQYLLSEIKTTRDDVTKIMKEKFGNYKKMCSELKL